MITEVSRAVTPVLIGPWGRKDAIMEHPGVRNSGEGKTMVGGREGQIPKIDRQDMTY